MVLHHSGLHMTLNLNNRILTTLTLWFWAFTVHAGQVGNITYSGNGYYTIGIGKMLSGTHVNVENYNCPCLISDYAQAAVYDGRSSLQWKPDSKLGVQGTASNKGVSLTTQIVARGASGSADLEWLYGNYDLNDKMSIQLGRKRLPMFYYSDVQDIGFALPWTHLPPGLYGWEAVNYNGVNVRYQDHWERWTSTANLLAGSESNNNSGYWKIYNGRQSRSNINWSNIWGGDLTLSKDWHETRLVYIQSNTQENLVSGEWNPNTQSYTLASSVIYPLAKQQIYGLTFKADYHNWLFHSEIVQIDHPGLNYKDHAQLLALGYHYEQWQPIFTWGRYKGTAVNNGLLPGVQPWNYSQDVQQTVSISIRYDVTATSDLKVQFDSETDHSDPGYSPNYGNARLLTFTYDRVF